MKQGRYMILGVWVIFCLMTSCTAPALKGQHGDTAVTKPASGCLKCHSTGEVEAGDAFTMHTIHFAALGEETRCAMCHPTQTPVKMPASTRAGATIPISEETAAKMEPYYLSWATSDFLDNRHNQHQVDCSGCHDGNTSLSKKPPMAQCIECHGSYAEVAQLPHDTLHNPHDSHMGEIECALCHKGHAKFEFYCNECHQFDDPSE